VEEKDETPTEAESQPARLEFVDGEDSTPKASATFDESTGTSTTATATDDLVDFAVEPSADDSKAADAEQEAVKAADAVEEEKKDGEMDGEGETSLVDISL
jgi:hypothetical protein